MPTNLYGPGDNYDSENSHVIPALIRKMHEGKMRGAASVTVWGTGAPRREFLHSDDMAAGCLRLMTLPEDEYSALLAQGDWPLVNVGCGADMTIAETARLVAEVVGYSAELVFDASRPDGTPLKRLDVSRLFALGWRPAVGLRQGLEAAYRDFLASKAAEDD